MSEYFSKQRSAWRDHITVKWAIRSSLIPSISSDILEVHMIEPEWVAAEQQLNYA